ncbi:MAG TPA: sigma-70 family RNA polymerase sigma factor [Kofleriaceae bacterium]
MNDEDRDRELVASALARDTQAIREVEAAVRAAAASAARRLGGDSAAADEIAQRMAEKLWLGRSSGGAPVLASYTGEAPLTAWLRVIAYREGVELLRAREVPDEAIVDRVVATTEPELAMLRSAYLIAFKRCFKAAFANLSMHERDIIRRHHLDSLSLDELAKLYGAHRATVARWLARVRERLVTETRTALRQELSGNTDLDDVLALIASRLEASLSREG